MAKSVVSLLVGQAIERGQLSEDDRLVDLIPELRTSEGYDEITVRDLLDMASGIDVSENYNPWWPMTGTARLLLSTDLPEYLQEHRELRFEPGTQGDYRRRHPDAGHDLGQGRRASRWRRSPPRNSGHRCRGQAGRDLEPRPCGKSTEELLLHQRGGATSPGSARWCWTTAVGDAQVVPEAWIERISSPK